MKWFVNQVVWEAVKGSKKALNLTKPLKESGISCLYHFETLKMEATLLHAAK